MAGNRIKKGKKSGQYEVESSSQKGKFYIVDTNRGSCSCPYWLFHLVKTGGKCKHMLAVEDKYSIKIKARKPSENEEAPKPKKKTKAQVSKLEKALDYVKSKGNVSSVEFIDKFSEDALNELIEAGEVIEEKGKIRIL